jgi:[ribosomal protein S5]-alanine N-acetyltransferase
MKQIETERLIMRELELSDALGLFELDSNPEVLKYIGVDAVKTIEESESVVRMLQQQYAENGIGRWAVIEKSTGEFMGWSGLKLYREPINNQTNIYELGYRFIPRYWGRGFATESARAWVDFAFEELKIDKLFAVTDLEHDSSKNVLHKVGFKDIEVFKYNGEDVNWLEVTKE